MNPKTHLSKFIFFIFPLILIINNAKFVRTLISCNKNDAISNKACFNDVLIFNNMKCRAGHSALNKDGLFILEFSNDGETGTRVFYGLEPNGRYYFSDNSPTKEVTLEAKNNIIARYESMNAFVALKNDINKEKEYFLSISTYTCFMEIYNITKESINYDTIYNGYYLGNQIFSFRFELFEAKYNNVVSYYLVFCHGEGNSGYGDKLSIKKIELSNLSFNTNDIVKTSTMESEKLNDRAISGFLLDDQEDENYRLLIVGFLRKSYDNSLSSKYKFNVYKLSDLSKKCEYQELYSDVITTNCRGENGKGYGVFFKFLYLGNRDTAMVYFKTNADNQDLFFQVLYVTLDGNCIKLPSKIYLEIKENLKTDLVLNDFIKLNETRLAFISTKDTKKLFILLMDLYNDNYNIQSRTYEYDISSYNLEKELSAHLYNGYLAFSSTVNNNGNMFSIFMIFGFGNGTDFIIDISPHLMDTGNYTEGNDLVTRLLKNLTIDNNIFGYIPIEQIILVSYPPELEFYSSDDQNTPLPNGTIIDKTHILSQNRRLNKTHKYYYLEYQYMVKEPDFDTFKSFSINTYDRKKRW